MFKIDKSFMDNQRLKFSDKIHIDANLNFIEKGINNCFDSSQVVQHGRVIAIRTTDYNRTSSAFKAGIYLGKYSDLDNVDRFLNKMVKAGHSYEPIRGENVLFLFLGVGKPVYDHLVTYTVGRPTRIAGGQRANLPWGFEVPLELKHDIEYFKKKGIESVDNIIEMTRRVDDSDNEMQNKIAKQQIQVARSLLPVGYIMPPFLMEFSEEALIKSVFRQRLFENGAQGATVDIVNDMFQCMLIIDPAKWSVLSDYHGSHTIAWQKAMRTLRDKKVTFFDLNTGLDNYLKSNKALQSSDDDTDTQDRRYSISVYDYIMETYGKLPPSMWDKKNK